jgi:type II secretory pathway pseudopilin PulG
MKKLVVVLIVLAVLAALFFGLLYSLASADRRARFINTMNDLKEAHFELQKYGAFTNQFHDATVYPFTNQFVIDGTNYQCEFAVECEDFTNRGFLTITTNEFFVWIDKKHGVMPPLSLRTFPPGF